MSLQEAISAPLRRNIKSGSQYNALIPKANCDATNLGNGKNNTIEGVEFMASIVDKYDHQAKKLAKKLKKSSVKASVDSVFNFLYNHVQYQADGELQRLLSPACAWKQRREGIDCKSYTIFAVSLLKNMGINSIIRQIKQPGFYNDMFTHVYTVVPVNQDEKANPTKYYTLDPTTHDNQEVQFSEKKDKYMQAHQYVALNAGAPQQKFHNKPVFGSISELKSFISNLHRVGFSEAAKSDMLNYVARLERQGVPAQQIILFVLENDELHIQKQGMNGKRYKPNGRKHGLSLSVESDEGNEADWFKYAWDMLTKSDWAKDIFNSISVGGDSSCNLVKTSGSHKRSTPEREAKRITEFIKPWFQQQLINLRMSPNDLVLEQRLNSISATFSAMIANALHLAYDHEKSCYRRAFRVRRKAFEQLQENFKQDIINGLSQTFNVSVGSQNLNPSNNNSFVQEIANPTRTLKFNHWAKWPNGGYGKNRPGELNDIRSQLSPSGNASIIQYSTFKLSRKPGMQNQDPFENISIPSGSGSSNSSSGSNSSNSSGTKTINPGGIPSASTGFQSDDFQNDTRQEASFSTPLMVAGAAVVLIPVIKKFFN